MQMLVTLQCDIDGLVQDCSNSSVLAMELLQSCNKPLMWFCIEHNREESRE